MVSREPPMLLKLVPHMVLTPVPHKESKFVPQLVPHVVLTSSKDAKLVPRVVLTMNKRLKLVPRMVLSQVIYQHQPSKRYQIKI